MPWNPHLRFYNNQRGYVRTRIQPALMTANFRVLPYVTSPGAAAHTRATFVIEDRSPGLHRTTDTPTPTATPPGAPRTPTPPLDTVHQETDRP